MNVTWWNVSCVLKVIASFEMVSVPKFMLKALWGQGWCVVFWPFIPSYFDLLFPKAVGEPPLFLAASVFFAIKDAISAARAEVNLDSAFRLDCPATAESIRMNCQDQFTQQVL